MYDFLANPEVIIAIIAIIGLIVGALRYLYNRGKLRQKEDTEIILINNKIKSMEKNLIDDKEEIHNMFSGISKSIKEINKKVDKLSTDLSYIKGNMHLNQ